MSQITTNDLMMTALNLRGRFLEQLIDRGKDIDKECGYPEMLTPAYLKSFYDREGICKRVVNIFPEEAWKQDPEVLETDDQNLTPFEVAWLALEKKFQLFSLLQRADKLSGIGTFGVILLGVDDGKQLIEPVDGVPLDGSMPLWLQGQQDPNKKIDLRRRTARNPSLHLIYTRVFDESAVTINKFEIDIRSPRYGQPLLYNINFIQYGVNTEVIQPVAPMPTSPTPVHWTRVIHLADNRESSEVYGVPRPASVVNRLIDLRKVLAGSGEMFWKGGFPGISFEVNPELQSVGQMDPEEMRKEFEAYQSGLQRYLALVGVQAKSLTVQLADPASHFKTHVQAICASIGCPYRVFIGTEEARLAGDQDTSAWNERIGNRQSKYCEPYVLNPLVTRLIYMGILPPLADMNKGTTVTWEDLHTPSDEEKAKVAAQLADALNKYVTGGCDTILPPKLFLKLFMNMTDEEADAAMKELTKYLKQGAQPGSTYQALHPPAPASPQPSPPGGMPIPNTGKGGARITEVSNFPNAGDPFLQARAARGGAFGKGGLRETQGPFTPPRSPGLRAPGKIEPSVVKKPVRPASPTLHGEGNGDGDKLTANYVRKVPGGWAVFSHKGKRLSKPMSEGKAHQRLAEIEYFKKQGKADNAEEVLRPGYSAAPDLTENASWRNSPKGREIMAREAGKRAKEAGLGPQTPTEHARTREGRKGFRAGYHSTTRKR
jgi:hypothetical protein